jgi:hypothetical protein
MIKLFIVLSSDRFIISQPIIVQSASLRAGFLFPDEHYLKPNDFSISVHDYAMPVCRRLPIQLKGIAILITSHPPDIYLRDMNNE